MSNSITGISFILVIFLLATLIYLQEIRISDLEEDLNEISSIIPHERIVTFKEARQRAKFINWQIQELGMQCSDAITIANSAYDIVNPQAKEQEYTSSEIDSIREEAAMKAYAREWASYERRNE